MLGEPEAMISPHLCMSREIKRIAKRVSRRCATRDESKIENRKSGHGKSLSRLTG
jgi:hypothetical protein